MKIVKSYFNEENTLNKGYQNDSDNKKRKEIENNSEILSLAAYEEVNPGSMKKLLEIASKEQEHQHNLEKSQIRAHNMSRYFGYLCGLISIFVISFFSFLIISLSTVVGIIFIICSFGAMIVSFAVSHFPKFKSSKDHHIYKNRNHSYNKNRFNNDKRNNN